MNLLDQPTPRTDEAETANKFPGSKEYYEMVVHARQLERELADAKAECEKFETELTRLRAEVYQARKAWLGDDYGHLPLIDALEKFRSDSDAESDRFDALYQSSCEVEHDLRAEVERLMKQIKDDNRSYGCELRDPNGTIWEQATKDRARAERAEAECLEQARLLGMSGEREADLLGKLFRLRSIIERASVKFFHQGTDGEIATSMIVILREAK